MIPSVLSFRNCQVSIAADPVMTNSHQGDTEDDACCFVDWIEWNLVLILYEYILILEEQRINL